jgi:hypothetical protein
VRSVDERAEALRDLGIEIVVGDYGNYRSLVIALDGVEAAYFCHPSPQALRKPQDSLLPRGESKGSGASWTFPLQQLDRTAPVPRDGPSGWRSRSSNGLVLVTEDLVKAHRHDLAELLALHAHARSIVSSIPELVDLRIRGSVSHEEIAEFLRLAQAKSL